VVVSFFVSHTEVIMKSSAFRSLLNGFSQRVDRRGICALVIVGPTEGVGGARKIISMSRRIIESIHIYTAGHFFERQKNQSIFGCNYIRNQRAVTEPATGKRANIQGCITKR